MDLFSRRIIGWKTSSRMTEQLVIDALQSAFNIRQPKGRSVIFHSDRGSQYTSKSMKNYLKQRGMRQSMGDVGACWDNAVVERFFGSLKHDWILKVHHRSRESMKQDIGEYIRYYNLERLHSFNDGRTPIEAEAAFNQAA